MAEGKAVHHMVARKQKHTHTQREREREREKMSVCLSSRHPIPI
jgi:hypothetical protein